MMRSPFPPNISETRGAIWTLHCAAPCAQLLRSLTVVDPPTKSEKGSRLPTMWTSDSLASNLRLVGKCTLSGPGAFRWLLLHHNA